MAHLDKHNQEQTIFLTSERRSSSETTQEFSNILYKEVSFSSDWEVCLDSITYTKGSSPTWHDHVNHWTVLAETSSSSLKPEYSVSPSMYGHCVPVSEIQGIMDTKAMIDALIATINKLFPVDGNHNSLFYIEKRDELDITINPGVRFAISQAMAHLLDQFLLTPVTETILPNRFWLNPDISQTYKFILKKKGILP